MLIGFLWWLAGVPRGQRHGPLVIRRKFDQQMRDLHRELAAELSKSRAVRDLFSERP